jgi:hypothetical protein
VLLRCIGYCFFIDFDRRAENLNHPKRTLNAAIEEPAGRKKDAYATKNILMKTEKHGRGRFSNTTKLGADFSKENN